MPQKVQQCCNLFRCHLHILSSSGLSSLDSLSYRFQCGENCFSCYYNQLRYLNDREVKGPRVQATSFTASEFPTDPTHSIILYVYFYHILHISPSYPSFFISLFVHTFIHSFPFLICFSFVRSLSCWFSRFSFIRSLFLIARAFAKRTPYPCLRFTKVILQFSCRLELWLTITSVLLTLNMADTLIKEDKVGSLMSKSNGLLRSPFN